MIKVVTVEQMRSIEKATDAAGVSYAQMMQHAGRAVADVVKELLDDDAQDNRVAVLVGPGNNGGDGLVAARILKEETDAEVGCYLLKARDDSDEVFATARDAGVFIAVAEDDQRWRALNNLVSTADVVVDALLGTGARLPIEGDMQKLLKQASSALVHLPYGLDADGAGLTCPSNPAAPEGRRAAVVAVDCPSGLDCDTGALDPLAIQADITVTFAAAKFGQFIFPGAEAVGALFVAGIGTPAKLTELAAVDVELADGAGVVGLLPARPRNSHKGTFGHVMVVAGSVNYTGAAALSAQAAYRAGAGLVTLAVPQAIYPILASQLRETIWLLLPHDMGVISSAALEVFHEEAGEVDAMLLGPGLGREEATAEFMRGLFQGDQQAKKGSIGFGVHSREQPEVAGESNGLTGPLVVDADGLNLLSHMDGWWKLLPAGSILTPHPGEMARLCDMEMDAVQSDRWNVARSRAQKWNCVVVLKGAFTVIAGPDGHIVTMPFATDALATAGTGDVLSGCITGLLAQGLAPFDAAVAGAYVHGLAGQIASGQMSSRSVMAGDVLDALAEAFEATTGL